VYEVAGPIRDRKELTTARRASLAVFASVALSFAFSSFAVSGKRMLNGHALFPARSSNATPSGHSKSTEKGPAPGSYPSAAPPALPARPDARGEIKGKITYDGTLPKYRPLDMVNEPTCAQHYTTPVLPENVVSGPNKSLQNVVVYISEGAPEERGSTQPAMLKQRGCRYVPHVLAMETNQEVWVQNDDSVAHTVHPMARINKELNRSQPPGTPPLVIRYDKAEIIRVKCELHPWMHGFFVVLKNSHYSVSDESGGFSLPDLPPGKYTVTAWHEQFGEQSQVVSIGGGEAKALNFVFKVKP
jgi:Carboxypeptidase regulatory-like domain